MRSTLSRLAVVLSLVLVAVVLRVTDANPAIAQTQTIGAESPPSQSSTGLRPNGNRSSQSSCPPRPSK